MDRAYSIWSPVNLRMYVILISMTGKFDEQSVAVALEGGLGNQLFGWAAGYCLSKKIGSGLILSTHKLSQRGFALDGLELDAKIQNGLSNRRFPRSSKVFKEHSFAYDPRFEDIVEPIVLEGYFQSWRYFAPYVQTVREILRNFQLQSLQSIEISSQIEEAGGTTIHIRRGDYLALTNYHGLMGKEYYANALNVIQMAEPTVDYFVFSDDIESAKEIVTGAVRYIGPEEISSPIETLLTMSKGKNFIGANSSFSWWAGLSSESAGYRIFPRPWFATSQHDTRDLLLPSWISIGDSLC